MSLENVSECLLCGKPFMKFGRKQICRDCEYKEEEYFQKVREYLYDYPNASVEEVSQQTEVNDKIIVDWVKEGRLERAGLTMSYPCQMCGKSIHSGRVCHSCQSDLGEYKSELESKIGTEEKSQRMYIVDNKKKY